MDKIFLENDNFKKLYTCFMELAKEEKQKDAITQIMQTGEYNGFKVNSMLSNRSYDEKEERARRIYYADMILQNKDLFFELAKNGLNVFHGTKIDALETILSSGLHNSTELDNKGIGLKTGEELAMNNSPIYSIEKREFISLTDNYHTAVHYAGFPNEEIDLLAMQYGITPKKDTPIILCFNGESIKQKYDQSIVNISSTCNEIGITSSISPSEIKCIITTYDKLDEVKSIASKYNISVIGYDDNKTYQRYYSEKKNNKFYNVGFNITIDEEEFDKIKNNTAQTISYLSEEESSQLAENIKNDLLFSLIYQDNNGVPYTPLTPEFLIEIYNMNEKIAKKLALEVNQMFLEHKNRSMQNENSTPFNSDNYDDGPGSMGGFKR